MPKKLATPLTVTRQLWKFDESGETTATFQQATQRAMMALADLASNAEYVWSDANQGETRFVQKTSLAKVYRARVFCTMQDCNIIGVDGLPLFRSMSSGGRKALQMSESEFNEAWDQLPPELAVELYRAMLRANPQWATKEDLDAMVLEDFERNEGKVDAALAEAPKD